MRSAKPATPVWCERMARDTWGAPTKGWPTFGPDGRKVDDDDEQLDASEAVFDRWADFVSKYSPPPPRKFPSLIHRDQ